MLIGVTGKAGSGKDEFAKYFIDQHRFAKYAIASPIKRMIEAGFSLDPAVWDAREVKGTEWGRSLVHPDVWLLLAEQRRLQVNNLIITDVRFDNEAEWLLNAGGALFEVVRDAQGMDNAGHASEKGVSSSLIAHTVHNFGTIKDLNTKARAAWSVLNRG